MRSFRESLMTGYGMSYDAATAYIERYNDMVDRASAVADRYANGGASSLADTADDLAEAATPLGDAKPFELGDNVRSGDMMDIAARGVSEAQEAECYAQYERELDECRLYSSMTQDSYTYVACKAQAFANYNQCRGY
jgi:hypothetical protein